MIDRVRRAASTSMASRSRCRGTTISRSRPSVDQVARTPTERSTSTMRSTSTIRATLRSRVVPRLSSDAHSSATAPFLLVLTSIRPLRVWPPCTRRWVRCGPPSVTMGESSAAPMRVSISRLTFCAPCSMRWIADWLVPRRSASWACVRPRCWRAERTREPTCASGSCDDREGSGARRNRGDGRRHGDDVNSWMRYCHVGACRRIGRIRRRGIPRTQPRYDARLTTACRRAPARARRRTPRGRRSPARRATR